MSYHLVDHGFAGFGCVFEGLNAGEQKTAHIQIGDDADFVIWKTSGNVTRGGIGQMVGFIIPVTISVRDLQSGALISDGPMLWNTLFGNVNAPAVYFKAPARLKTPMIMAANSMIEVVVKNFGTFNFDLLTANFFGTKNFLRGYYL